MRVILDEKGDFLENLLREKLGDDVARCFTEYVLEIQNKWRYANESINEQERIADAYHSLCNDALDAFGRILEILEEPRLNRSKLKGVTRAGYDALNRNL